MRPHPAIPTAQADALLRAVSPHAYIAGGAARLILMRDNAPPTDDVDLFLYQPDGLDPCEAALSAAGYTKERDSRTSITYAGLPGLPVQIIKPFRDEWSLTYGAPAEVVAHFSFTTEMFSMTAGMEITVGPLAVQHTNQRLIVINNVTDPLIVAMRVAKYAAKGYRMDLLEMALIFREWDRRSAEWRANVAAKADEVRELEAKVLTQANKMLT